MKICIVVDMEGISGVVLDAQTDPSHAIYQEARRQFTADANAAVEGAIAGGAEQVVVVDGHGAGSSTTNLVYSELDPRAEYVMGQTWRHSNEWLNGDYNAAMLVGFHAMAGTDRGVVDHTMTLKWINFFLNGERMGETGICAALFGEQGVPVVMITGDEPACLEAKALLGEQVVLAPIKVPLARQCARCLSPTKAHELITLSAKQAMGRLGKAKPYSTARPTTITIEMHTTESARPYLGQAGIEIVDGRTVVSRGEHFLQAWAQVWGN